LTPYFRGIDILPMLHGLEAHATSERRSQANALPGFYIRPA
jgi:hypothetical protein